MSRKQRKRKRQEKKRPQDGWHYIRVKTMGKKNGVNQYLIPSEDPSIVSYDDFSIDSRIISSRKVERALVVDEYVRKCLDDRYEFMCHPDGQWVVYDVESPCYHGEGYGTTLKAAYLNYKNNRTRYEENYKKHDLNQKCIDPLPWKTL